MTEKLLSELGCEGKPIIPVFNKCDAAGPVIPLPTNRSLVMISALKGIGLDRLLSEIAKSLTPSRARRKLLLPFSESKFVSRLYADGAVHEEVYREDGIFLDVTAPYSLLSELSQYVISD